MHERIKELYQKAHDVYQWDYPSSPVDPSVKSVHTSRQFNPEKFAELIVRECADIAKHNVMNISTYSDAEFVSDLIHQNFGVK